MPRSDLDAHQKYMAVADADYVEGVSAPTAERIAAAKAEVRAIWDRHPSVVP